MYFEITIKNLENHLSNKRYHLLLPNIQLLLNYFSNEKYDSKQIDFVKTVFIKLDELAREAHFRDYLYKYFIDKFYEQLKRQDAALADNFIKALYRIMPPSSRASVLYKTIDYNFQKLYNRSAPDPTAKFREESRKRIARLETDLENNKYASWCDLLVPYLQAYSMASNEITHEHFETLLQFFDGLIQAAENNEANQNLWHYLFFMQRLLSDVNDLKNMEVIKKRFNFVLNLEALKQWNNDSESHARGMFALQLIGLHINQQPPALQQAWLDFAIELNIVLMQTLPNVSCELFKDQRQTLNKMRQVFLPPTRKRSQAQTLSTLPINSRLSMPIKRQQDVMPARQRWSQAAPVPHQPAANTQMPIKQKSNDPVAAQKIFSQATLDLLNEFIQQVASLLGKAPCDFAFCALGSSSRQDRRPYSDVELVFLYQPHEAVSIEHLQSYIYTLISGVELAIILLGESHKISDKNRFQNAGFHLDSSSHLLVKELIGTPQALAKKFVIEIASQANQNDHGWVDDESFYSLLNPLAINTQSFNSQAVIMNYRQQIDAFLNHSLIPQQDNLAYLVKRLNITANWEHLSRRQAIAFACFWDVLQKSYNLLREAQTSNKIDIKQAFYKPFTYLALNLKLYYGLEALHPCDIFLEAHTKLGQQGEAISATLSLFLKFILQQQIDLHNKASFQEEEMSFDLAKHTVNNAIWQLISEGLLIPLYQETQRSLLNKGILEWSNILTAMLQQYLTYCTKWSKLWEQKAVLSALMEHSLIKAFFQNEALKIYSPLYAQLNEQQKNNIQKLLAELYQNHIIHMVLDGLSIENTKLFAQALLKNTSIKTITFDATKFKGTHWQIICEVLAEHSALELIIIKGQEIPDATKISLQKLLKYKQTLQCLSLVPIFPEQTKVIQLDVIDLSFGKASHIINGLYESNTLPSQQNKEALVCYLQSNHSVTKMQIIDINKNIIEQQLVEKSFKHFAIICVDEDENKINNCLDEVKLYYENTIINQPNIELAWLGLQPNLNMKNTQTIKQLIAQALSIDIKKIFYNSCSILNDDDNNDSQLVAIVGAINSTQKQVLQAQRSTNISAKQKLQTFFKKITNNNQNQKSSAWQNYLLKIKNNEVNYLELNSFSINEKKFIELCQALKINQSIKSLDLSHIGLNAKSLAALAQLLDKNSSLQELSISINKISSIGYAIFTKALRNNYNLTNLNINTDSLLTQSKQNQSFNEKTQSIKIVLIGDGAVGKTGLHIAYTTGRFPHGVYVPTVFDNNKCSTTYDNQHLTLDIWDTPGVEQYDRIRPLCYFKSDIFIICFSLINRDSFINIRDKWYLEVRSQNIEASLMLVGTKVDLLTNNEVLSKLAVKREKPISEQEAITLAKEIGAISYLSCSSLTGENLKEIFIAAIRGVLQERKTLNAIFNPYFSIIKGLQNSTVFYNFRNRALLTENTSLTLPMTGGNNKKNSDNNQADLTGNNINIVKHEPSNQSRAGNEEALIKTNLLESSSEKPSTNAAKKPFRLSQYRHSMRITEPQHIYSQIDTEKMQNESNSENEKTVSSLVPK